MHVSEASAPHLHLRNDPVNSSADDGQAKLSNATPQFHVAASVESGPVLPDTIAPNGALADTTHENVTSRCTRLRSYSLDETPVVVGTKSTIAKLQPCYSCGEIGTGNHLKVPSTPHRRRDSFHKSSASSEGDNDSELYRLTPPDSGSRPLSPNQEARESAGSRDWSTPTQWRTRSRLRTSPTPSLIGEWTTSGADEPSDFDETEYEEDKFTVSVSAL